MQRSEIKRGSALLLVIIITSVLAVLAVIFLKIVYNTYATTKVLAQREQAFWLAEAGLGKGEIEINRNPAWYTDLPHYPEDDAEWLKIGAMGQSTNLGEGWFKVVREREKNRLYAVGYKGKATVVLKIDFAAPPFRVLNWEEI